MMIKATCIGKTVTWLVFQCVSIFLSLSLSLVCVCVLCVLQTDFHFHHFLSISNENFFCHSKVFVVVVVGIISFFVGWLVPKSNVNFEFFRFWISLIEKWMNKDEFGKTKICIRDIIISFGLVRKKKFFQIKKNLEYE